MRLRCPPSRAVATAEIDHSLCSNDRQPSLVMAPITSLYIAVVAADREDAAEGFLTLQGGLDHFPDKLGAHPLQQPHQLTAR